MAATRDMSTVLPGVPGPLCAGHPASCNALIQAAEAAGAQVVRGVDRVHVTPGSPPEVRFDLAGSEQRLECALVIGADGRTSSVRAQAGIPLQQAPPTHLVAGLLVDGVPAWPQDSYSIGTQDDVMFFVFPQGGERVRLYFCTTLDQRDRFAGAEGRSRFLETFRTLSALPPGPEIADGTPIGPCATLTGEDTWTDVPFVQGVALIGDAAGYNDPIIGEGLSLALRDVSVLSKLLLQNQDWSPEGLMPYAEERRERMRRLRFTAALVASLASEFGPEAAERRRRFGRRMQEGSDPQLKFALAATTLGPDNVPAFAFEDSMRQKVLA
jgi:2-polyprenyl-6-methoxyphenol hydroxylase-like FAD-dependent oxidoreductase